MIVQHTQPVLLSRMEHSPEIEDLGVSLAAHELELDGDRLSFQLLVTACLPENVALAFDDQNAATMCVVEHATKLVTMTLEDPHFSSPYDRDPNYIPPAEIDVNRQIVSYAQLFLEVTELDNLDRPILITAFLLEWFSNTLSLDLGSLSWSSL